MRKDLVSKSKYSIKCPYSMSAEFIVVHNTANDASAANEVKYMINNSNQVSYHFAIDDKEVVQALPLDRNAWHAGDGANGNGNRKGLSIEICYSKSGGTRFYKAQEQAAKFIALLLHERKWDISKVKKHQDFSGKYCPHRTLDYGWTKFLAMISAELELLQKPKDFLVQIICPTLNIRKSASFDSAVVGVVKKGEVFTIIEQKNGLGRLKSGIGWISMHSNYVKTK